MTTCDEASGLSDQDVRLLQALAAEHDMTAVAESLSWSTRHTRRRTKDLLTRLGVASTRAAVAVAAAHGFIEEPPSTLHRCNAVPDTEPQS